MGILFEYSPRKHALVVGYEQAKKAHATCQQAKDTRED
jgi:hypothetical protein